MRPLHATVAAAALMCATSANASRARCLEWQYVFSSDAGTSADAGTSSSSSPLEIGAEFVLEPADAGDAGAIDPDAGLSVPPPRTGARICKKWGYLDEGGCSASPGGPSLGAALALMLVLNRAHRVRRVRRTARRG